MLHLTVHIEAKGTVKKAEAHRCHAAGEEAAARLLQNDLRGTGVARAVAPVRPAVFYIRLIRRGQAERLIRAN